MTIWYVDSAVGSDSNDGKTPGTAFLTIQHAHDQTNPGDTVYIMPGKGYGGGATETATLAISRSGSASGGYITYSGYPGLPMPIINGLAGSGGANSTQSIQFGGVFAFNGCKPSSYVIFQNLHFFGNAGALSYQSAWGDAFAGTGTDFYNTSCISCVGLSSQSSRGFGSDKYTASSTTSSSTTLPLNTSDGTSYPITAIQVGDVVADITNQARIPKGTTVTAVSSPNITLSVACSVTSGDAIRVFHPIHHIQILNCIIHDFPANGIGLDFADYITISNCLIYNCSWYCNNATSAVEAFYQALDVDTNTSTYKNIISGNVIFANANLVPWTVANTPVSTTASGGTSSTTLNVASASGLSNGQGVADATNNARILAGTYVTNISGTTITLSQAANGVVSGDTIKFSQFSDGEGILFDDTAGDQGGGSGVVYAGKSLVTNNVCMYNGSSGIQVFDSANVDVTFNTCYNNMAHPAYASFFAYGDIYYSSNGTNRNCSGICANNIVQVTGSIAPIKLNASGGGSVSGVTASNNLSFGNSTVLPGTNNLTNQDPLFVSAPATAVTFLTSSGATITNGGIITGLVPASVGNSSAPAAAFPNFTNFQLQPASPAIDTGTGTATRTTDFLGNVGEWGPAYDMGAYESPCSPFSGNPIQTISTLMTLLANNSSGAITPLDLREVVTTLVSGKSPYPR